MTDTSTPPRTRFSPQPAAALLILLSLGAAIWMSGKRARKVPHRAAVTSAVAPRTSEQRCAECHFEIVEQFQRAPHARTLHRATDKAVVDKFAGRSFHREDANVDYHYELRDGQLLLSTPAYARDLPITWIFGSGTHAQTPLMTWTDNAGRTAAIEHSVSWYPADQLGITLGRDEWKDSSGLNTLGRHWGPAETINCFGCHSTFVPTQGERIVFDNIQPNVSCARCHWNTEDHVRELEQGQPTTIERFSQMTPRESVDRCGECHRRASEMGGPITPDEVSLVRFAPVGLVQSPCFTRQEVSLDSQHPTRLDCTTCHDPHRPAQRDWRSYTRTCLTCHDAGRNRAADCTVATRQENCLTCHMPKIAVNESLEFTDHWIRIRDDSPQQAASE